MQALVAVVDEELLQRVVLEGLLATRSPKQGCQTTTTIPSSPRAQSDSEVSQV